MFRKTKMVFAVNKAVAELGINPATVDSTYRLGLIDIALSDGLSAQEVATFIFFQLPLGYQPDNAEQIIALWRSEGKIRQEAIDQAQRSR